MPKCLCCFIHYKFIWYEKPNNQKNNWKQNGFENHGLITIKHYLKKFNFLWSCGLINFENKCTFFNLNLVLFLVTQKFLIIWIMKTREKALYLYFPPVWNFDNIGNLHLERNISLEWIVNKSILIIYFQLASSVFNRTNCGYLGMFGIWWIAQVSCKDSKL